MKKIKDITGKKFGHLTAIKFSRRIKNTTFWWFECDCVGKTIKEISYANVRNKIIKSCGCLRKNQLRTHGLSSHPLYKKWFDLKKRCYDTNSNQYSDYGGRGIKICDEWLNRFENFYEWSIQNGWQEGLEIDRSNNNGDYEPNNCRYITHDINCNNKRNNRQLTLNGITKNIQGWSKTLSISRNTIEHRLRRGWSIEKTLTTPVRK